MFAPKDFKITRPTLGFDISSGNLGWVDIPIGAVVKVTSGPRDGKRLADVLWNGRQLMMFSSDLRNGAAQITEGLEIAERAKSGAA